MIRGSLVAALILSGCASAGAVDAPVLSGIGKQVRVIVGMPPGGGVDAYARLVQRHLAAHLPNTPGIVVQNVPGAGSLRSVMALANSWQDADTSIATFSSSLLTEAIIDPDRLKIDFRDFAFLGNVAEDSRVCFVTTRSGVVGLDDLKSRAPLTFGATAAGTSGNLDTSILRKLLGVKLSLVLGYPGSAEKRLAMERGEIDADCAGATSLPPDWLKSGKIKVLVRFSPTLPPGVDQATPFGGDLLADDASRKVYDFLVTPQRLGRLFMVSRKISPSAIKALRAAFAATMVDPEFVRDANGLGFLVTPTNGEDVDQRIAALYATPRELISRARSVSED
jgi:tripartite-type tricarboxylate transporter receptor subunit TctC